jgi:hypothetical protein
MNKAQIDVTNGGPIEGTFSIDLSQGPGVYEFRGARGTGKTTCISSIDWLTGHKVDVTLHDNADDAGQVQGFGVIAPIGSRKRRKGELDLDTIDAEKFSLTDLIDPPGQKPEVRDAHAIKALATLSETKADVSLYYELAGGQQEFDKLGISKTSDPVLLATRIKQAYEKTARTLQNTADAEAEHAAPLEAVPDGLDMSQSSDLDTLATERDTARDHLQTLKRDRTAGQEAEKNASHAAAKLEQVKTDYTGMTVAQATHDTDTALGVWQQAEREVERLEESLKEAKAARDIARNDHSIVKERLATAKQHDEAVSALEAAASQTATYPSQNDIDSAQATVDKASEAYDQGIRIRDVKQNHSKAATHRTAANNATKLATASRNKAAKVFDILARSLNTEHLIIRSFDGDPRLFVEHSKRGLTAFDKVNGLSDGERVDFSLRELLPHIESPGLLPIPQRVWQDLQPSDRKSLHELAKEKGLYLFGAQVTDGELHVAYLGDE